MLKKIGNVFLVLLLSVSAYSQDEDRQGKVYATVSDNEVSVGQTLAYNIIIENMEGGSSGNPRLPDIKGFRLLNTQTGTEARSEFVNGKFTLVKKQIYTYFLAPEAPGTYTLGAAEVVVGGQTYRTQSISIKVLGGNAPQRAQSRDQVVDEQDSYDPFEEADKIFDQLLKRSLPQAQQDLKINPDEAFFVRVEVDKNQAYVGEQVTATWYLYTRNNLTNFEPVKYPDLKGFWKEDIEIATRLNFENVVINGIPYRKALLVSYALFPLKAGTATIDSYKLKATAMIVNPMGVFGRPYTFTKTNPPVKINVLPIPTENQPADFSNAVGSFNMTAQVDRTNVAVNEPFTFKLRFDGRGNAKQIELPALNLSDKFEQYDTKEESKFYKDGTSFKQFEILLIPRVTGALEIPALSASFFNPQSKKFERKSTQPIKLNVTQGKNLTTGASESYVGQAVQATAKKMLPPPIYNRPSFQVSNKVLNFVWSSSFILALLFSGVFFVKELRSTTNVDRISKEFSKRVSSIQKIANTNLREASVQSLNLADYVLGEVTQEKDKHAIADLLQRISPIYKNEFGDEFRSALKYFETLAFAPQELVKDIMTDKKFQSEFKVLKNTLHKVILIYSKNG